MNSSLYEGTSKRSLFLFYRYLQRKSRQELIALGALKIIFGLIAQSIVDKKTEFDNK